MSLCHRTDSIIIHKRLHKHKEQYEIIITHIWNVDSLYFVWQWSTLVIFLQWWNRSRWCNIWLFNVFPIVFGQQCSLARMLKLLFTGWYIRQNLDTVLKWCFCNSYSSFDKRYITSLCFVFFNESAHTAVMYAANSLLHLQLWDPNPLRTFKHI